jgi:hypothetical protein
MMAAWCSRQLTTPPAGAAKLVPVVDLRLRTDLQDLPGRQPLDGHEVGSEIVHPDRDAKAVPGTLSP